MSGVMFALANMVSTSDPENKDLAHLNQLVPYFTVGITGHMDLPEGAAAVVKDRIRSVFKWLRNSRFKGCAQFGPPLGLNKTPIALYSPLAPGSDQLAAELALEEGMIVKGVLPFALPYYRKSSSFIRDDESDSEVRLNEFDALVKRVGEENLFAVSHVDDPPDPDDHFWNHQLQDRELRNRRYRVAGEFVAAHCDLLIAVCDQEKPYDPPERDPELTLLADAGTRAITASYIRGIHPGILPLPPSLSWQDNGPLIRIFCPNAREGEATNSNLEIGDVRIWHPADSNWDPSTHNRIHKQEMAELREVSTSLEKLAIDLEKESDFESSIEDLFVASDGIDPEEDTIDEIRDLSPRLDGLLKLFPVVDKLAMRYERLALAHTNFSYFLGLLVFFSLAFYEAGNPFLFYVAIGFTVLGFCAQLVARKVNGIFKKREDYRTLAEGLRIQSYWSAAGLNETVSANYLQRLRGEVAWIRAAINSIVQPCEEIARGFGNLKSHHEKYEWLRRVWSGWVSGQQWYFERATYRVVKLREILKFLSVTFLVGGGMIVIFVFLLKYYPSSSLSEGLKFALRNFGSSVWFVWAGLLISAIIVFAHSDGHFRKSLLRDKNGKDQELVRDLIVFDFYKHWVFRSLCGVIFGFLIYSFIYNFTIPIGQGTSNQDSGGLHDGVTRLAKAILLAMGGLWLGYGNTRFVKEDSKRYADMRGQFGAAKQKVDSMLKEYKSAIDAGASEKELDVIVSGIQKIYLTLGREALHEQTEWLLMRRNRPVEPVAKVR